MSPRLRERVITTRWIFLIVAVVYPLFLLLGGEVQPHHHDPLSLRLVVSGVCLLLLGLSFDPKFARRHLHPFVMTVVYLITGHFFYLLATNRLAPVYLIGLLLVLAGIYAAATLAFQSRRGLRAFLGFVAAGALASAWFASDPLLDPAFYLLVLFTALGLSWVALSSLIRSHYGLRESRRRLDAVVSAAPVLLWSIDTARRIRFAKGSGMETIGREPDDYVGASLANLFDDGPDLRVAIGRALDGESDVATVEVEGRTFETWHVPRWSTAGKIEGAIGVAIDVTERRRMEERLRRREEQLAEAQEIAHLGSWEWNAVEDTVRWSDEMYRIFGYEPGGREFDFSTYIEHVHPEDREKAEAAVTRALEEGEPFGFDERIVRPDGEERVIEVEGRPVTDEEGDRVGLIGTVHDVTDRVRAEEQLRQAQKMEAVGRVAGGVAHDFNNVLVAILGYSELLENESEDPVALERIGEIRSAAKRAGNLVKSLLSFSRRRPLELERLDPGQVIADLRSLLRRVLGDEATLTLKLADTGDVEVDRSGFEQTLMNLAVNARDAMEGGGRMRIGLRERTLPGEGDGRAAELPEGRYVEVCVTDDGCGMDRETAERAFEPFYTTKPEGEGTGLGLATVYGFADRSGGTVTVDSEPGNGTTFRIYLPVVVERAPALTAPPLPSSTPPAPPRVRRRGG
ncbi:MAG: PAS domain S-box protein [Gemmatimonadota bacterium]|nr:PAS domain S-box protein [Gemmatimonadota bacterium]